MPELKRHISAPLGNMEEDGKMENMFKSTPNSRQIL